MIRSLVTLTALASLTLASAPASAAPSRAWAAARTLDVDAPVLMGVDVKSFLRSASYKALLPRLLAKEPNAQVVMDRLKGACKIDAMASVNSMVAAVDDADESAGGFFIALSGLTSSKLATCVQKIAAADGKKLTVGPIEGGIQQLAMAGDETKLFVGWIGRDVLVIARDPSNREQLAKLLARKGATDGGRLAEKIDTGATVWMVVRKEQSVMEDVAMKAVYGTVKLAKGTASADLRVITGDAAQASSLSTLVGSQLPSVTSALPAAAARMVKSLRVTASGDEVKVTVSAPEKDLIELVTSML